MARAAKIGLWVVGALAGLALLLIVGVIVGSRTDWVAERVSRIAVTQLEAVGEGDVRIGRVEGALLREIRLVDVAIDDAEGRPFLRADTLETGYSIVSLLRKRIVLTNLRLVGAHVVIDQPPGEEWNFLRIFPIDPDAPEPEEPGWGDWISLEDVRLVDGRVEIRTEWTPPPGKGPEDVRDRIEAVRGGLQSVREFGGLHGHLPTVRLAEPEAHGMRFDVAALEGSVALFEPPWLEVRDLTGTFRLRGGGLLMEDVRAVLPASELAIGGVIDFATGDVRLEARGAPVAFSDFRWIHPPLPEEGGGELALFLDAREGITTLVVDEAQLRVRESALAGRIAITVGEAVLLLGETDLRVTDLDTRLIEATVPGLVVPRHGTLTGRARLEGPAAAIRTAGDLTFSDPLSGTSRVAVEGLLGVEEELRFEDFLVRFEPLRLELVRALGPELPIEGPLRGTARLDGAPARDLVARIDVVHAPATGRSRFTGSVEVATEREWARVDLRLLPLSLATVGAFAPAAELRGEATGSLRGEGDLADFVIVADLEFPGGGGLETRAALDLSGAEPAYDIESTLRVLDVAAVSARAPAATSLTGELEARGRGLDPATMRAEVEATLAATRVDDVEVDSLRVRLAVADGLARVDSAVVRLGGSHVLAHGDLGLVGERRGELAYEVAIDSLEVLLPYLPYDTLSGRAHASGRVEGWLGRFDVTGDAELDHVGFEGGYVGRGHAEYELRDVGTPELGMVLEGAADSVRVAGFAFERASAEIRLRGDDPREGRAVLAVHQDDDTEYRVDAELSLALERNEVRLHDVELRFDTTRWAAVQPATVAWNRDGIEVAAFELRSEAGGRIFLDGRLPAEGSGELDVQIDGMEIGHVSALLQQDAHATGIVRLDARVEGTLASPLVDADLSWVEARLDGHELPDIRATATYRDTELSGDAELSRDGRLLAVAEGRVPLDLALAEREGPRLLDRPLEVDIRADSLPLSALPSFIDQVGDVEGEAVGHVSVRGVVGALEVDGALELRLPSIYLVPLGVRYQDVTGSLRLEDRVVVVDSIVGWSRGSVRLEGTVDVASLEEPTFDLHVLARGARVLDNEYGRLRVDGEIEVGGPIDGVRVSGEVRTRTGVLYIPEHRTLLVDLDDPDLVRDVDPEIARELEEVIEPSRLMRGLEIDVQLHLGLDTWVRSADANVEVYTPPEVGPITIRRNPETGRLALEGTVITDRGQYAFMGRRFELTRGTATFLPNADLDPLIQIAAEHEVPVRGRENLRIRLVIEGTAFEPTLQLESSAQPPISQTDLISFLAFGRSASGLMHPRASGVGGEGSGGGLAGNIAGLATQQLAAIAANTLLDEFEAEAGRALGLDVLQITPAEVPPEIFRGRNLDDLRRATEIEAGAYIGGRLFAAAHARPTTEALPGMRMEYRAPQGIRVTTSWEPRFLPPTPTLSADQDPDRTRVFGAFLRREWRF